MISMEILNKLVNKPVEVECEPTFRQHVSFRECNSKLSKFKNI